MDLLMLACVGIQTVVVTATAAFAWISIQKFRDSRAIDFVIDSEGNIDPLYQGLAGAPVDLIKNIYRGHDVSRLPDDVVKAFPFMYALYAHVGRIHYMLVNQHTDLGLSQQEKDGLVDAWLSDIAAFRRHPAMLAVHAFALANSNFNPGYLDKVTEVLSA